MLFFFEANGSLKVSCTGICRTGAVNGE